VQIMSLLIRFVSVLMLVISPMCAYSKQLNINNKNNSEKGRIPSWERCGRGRRREGLGF
jgi:hypothetical protein